MVEFAKSRKHRRDVEFLARLQKDAFHGLDTFPGRKSISSSRNHFRKKVREFL